MIISSRLSRTSHQPETVTLCGVTLNMPLSELRAQASASSPEQPPRLPARRPQTPLPVDEIPADSSSGDGDESESFGESSIGRDRSQVYKASGEGMEAEAKTTEAGKHRRRSVSTPRIAVCRDAEPFARKLKKPLPPLPPDHALTVAEPHTEPKTTHVPSLNIPSRSSVLEGTYNRTSPSPLSSSSLPLVIGYASTHMTSLRIWSL